MTTAPVQSITEEELRFLEEQVDETDPEGPSWISTADVLRLIAHIRSLDARLAYIERNFIGVQFDYDCGERISVMAIKIGDYVPVCRSAASIIDAAIAQEASHE